MARHRKIAPLTAAYNDGQQILKLLKQGLHQFLALKVMWVGAVIKLSWRSQMMHLQSASPPVEGMGKLTSLTVP